jgi:hypothetical protein
MTAHDDVSHGWSLPFAERYQELQRLRAALPAEIERERDLIAARQLTLDGLVRYSLAVEAAWKDMHEHDAGQIAAIEANRDAVRAALREAGWNL